MLQDATLKNRDSFRVFVYVGICGWAGRQAGRQTDKAVEGDLFDHKFRNSSVTNSIHASWTGAGQRV